MQVTKLFQKIQSFVEEGDTLVFLLIGGLFIRLFYLCLFCHKHECLLDSRLDRPQRKVVLETF